MEKVAVIGSGLMGYGITQGKKYYPFATNWGS